jgi:RNA polymerase sigma-70 factor, ECF subfamily
MTRATRTLSEPINDLMVRFAHGDHLAPLPLFGLLRPIVIRYCRCGLTSCTEAEDAAQEVLAKVFERIAAFDCSRDGVGWVLGIARFEILNRRNRARRAREDRGADVSALPTSGAGADEAIAAHERIHALQAAMHALGPQDRTLFTSLVSEIPEKVPSTPCERKRKQRALQRLQAEYEKHYAAR